MKTKSLVSVIISAYNAEKNIEATLESVLAQTWAYLEIIVVNDGSVDNTAKLLSAYENRNVKVINQPNKGQDAALNEGYKNSTGDYIKFMDSDDLINPDMISIQAEALFQNVDSVAYGEWYRFFGNKPSKNDITAPLPYWRNMQPIDFLLEDGDGPMLQCAIMLIPRTIIEKAGLWDERLILYNDTEFFTRIILAANSVIFTKGAILFYRSGLASSLTAQGGRKYFESTFLATKLVEKALLEKEDSARVKQNISNIYFRRLYDMYPLFPDLAKKHQEKINNLVKPSITIRSGHFHNFIYSFFGWKLTKRMHYLRQVLKRKFKR